jgi:hypothetical protein
LGKSSKEKIGLAEKLLRNGTSYRLIQEELIKKFGSGMSNTTLKNLQRSQSRVINLEEKIEFLEDELALFKKLYFQLRRATKKRLVKEFSPKE